MVLCLFSSVLLYTHEFLLDYESINLKPSLHMVWMDLCIDQNSPWIKGFYLSKPTMMRCLSSVAYHRDHSTGRIDRSRKCDFNNFATITFLLLSLLFMSIDFSTSLPLANWHKNLQIPTDAKSSTHHMWDWHREKGRGQNKVVAIVLPGRHCFRSSTVNIIWGPGMPFLNPVQVKRNQVYP